MDIRDSRDIQERISELEALGGEIDESDKEELVGLLAFKEDVDSPEWDCGITFINEADFEDYAREFAQDIGAISNDAQWPATCIDWEEAARELLIDYSPVDFDGITYYFR